MKKIILLSLSTVTALIMLSCQQQRTQTTSGDDRVREDLQELKADLKELGREIDIIAEKEGNEFKSEAKRLVEKFNDKIAEFEEDMKETGKEMDSETQDLIDDLEAEGKKLDLRLDKYGDQSQANWEEFKEEVKRDFNKFGDSIEDFFQDNV